MDALVAQVEQKQLRGGQLLDMLYKQSICGVPILKESLTRYYSCSC